MPSRTRRSAQCVSDQMVIITRMVNPGGRQGILDSVQAVQVLDGVVAAVGVSMGASTLLQAWRIFRRRRSDDVSAVMLVVLIVGAVLWLAYGFVHDLVPIIATNATWLVGASLALAATLRYRRVPPGAEPPGAEPPAAAGTTDRPPRQSRSAPASPAGQSSRGHQ
jgi:MtN3 and saliva related transmembrane protein